MPKPTVKKQSADDTSIDTLEERLGQIDAHQIKAQAAEADNRRAVGRYTLDEAADLLNLEAGERRDSILTKLIQAAASGDLRTYEPGCHTRMEYEVPEDVCSFYEEVYWDDLNKWLSKEERRMLYQFPSPTMPERSETGKQPAGSSGENDLKLIDIQQAFDELRKESGKQPSQTKVAERANYDRSTVARRWHKIKK